jgi:hypothetical protein
VSRLAQGAGLRGPAVELIRLHVTRHPRVTNVDAYLAELGRFLRGSLSVVVGEDGSGAPTAETAQAFTPEEGAQLSRFLGAVRDDALAAQAARAIDSLQGRLVEVERRPRASGKSRERDPDKGLDREVAALLVELARAGETDLAVRNQGGLVLFYFSLHKLFRSEKVTALIGSLVPTRPDGRGRPVRDRRRQVRDLVEGNSQYKQRYLKTLKSLYPIVTRQMANVVSVFGVSGLLLRGPDGKVLRDAYVKLLTGFLHDTLYSGLSVVIGFPYRAAARAFSQGAEKALAALRRSPADRRPGPAE